MALPSIDRRRAVPATDQVLADPRLTGPQARLGRARVRALVRESQDRIRDGRLQPHELVDDVLRRLPHHATSLTRVLNGTGVPLHTNLGRAPLSDAARDAVVAATGYVDVEYDLSTGKRAVRGRGALAALRALLPEAGDVHVVNNGAAALLLAVTVLAQAREVVWSRGEMVAIGDGFRLPELVASTGARVREVGTTNRSVIDDYRSALGEHTGCILKVHPSNFRIAGFSASVSVAELRTLGVPLVVDAGSGLLAPDPLFPDELDLSSALRDGADIVVASGDKLLGGPQAGIIAGSADLVLRLRRHPMARALRVDKMTLAALEATLAGPEPPVWRAVHADPERLRARAEAVALQLGGAATVTRSDGTAGGGSAPELALPGWAICLPEQCAARLRSADPPVIGRIERGRCLVDLRCIDERDDELLIAAVRSCM